MATRKPNDATTPGKSGPGKSASGAPRNSSKTTPGDKTGDKKSPVKKTVKKVVSAKPGEASKGPVLKKKVKKKVKKVAAGTGTAAAKKPLRKPTPEEEAGYDPFAPQEKGWVARNKQAFLVYTVSTLFHAVILLGMSFYMLDKETQENLLALITASETIDETEEELDTIEEPQEITELEPTDSNQEDVASEAIADTPSPVELNVNDLDPSMIMETVDFGAAPNIKVSTEMAGRSEAARAKNLAESGGSAASEKAVSSALKWIASVQHPNGSWDFGDLKQASQPGSLKNSTMGATGMALLSFLGAGHTHEKGTYAKNVEGGIVYLMKNLKVTPEGADLRGVSSGHEGMYVQGICTIALTEAYAMTPPKGKYRRQLKIAAQQAVNFVIRAQDPKGGGWRYQPRQAGDTSVVGWQLMGLVSGKHGELIVPSRIFDGVTYFLNSVTNDGATYGYTGKDGRPATTAVGLLCRMYLGWNANHQGLKDGIAYLSKIGPSKNNMYFNYYATQVMHHWGGAEWKKWNEVMREQLIRTQVQKEGPDLGSWNLADSHGGRGGRLYMTALSVMTLEVYYRHLPIYKRKTLQAKDI